MTAPRSDDKPVSIGDVAEFRAKLRMGMFGEPEDFWIEELEECLRGSFPDDIVDAFKMILNKKFAEELCKRAITNYHDKGDF